MAAVRFPLTCFRGSPNKTFPSSELIGGEKSRLFWELAAPIDRDRVATQLEAQRNGKALPFAVSLIRQKIRNSIETLTAAVPHSPTRVSAIKKLNLELALLDKHSPRSIRTLLGIEGRSAFAYFNAWQSLPLRWKGTGRHPIPGVRHG